MGSDLKERIEYLDVIKGYAMILVVFCHYVLLPKESVLGKHKNSKVTTVIGWVAVLWVVFLSVNQILLWNGIAL